MPARVYRRAPAACSVSGMDPTRARARAFTHVVVNTAATMLGTAFLWYAVTFWAYLETRNVMVTSFLGGAYMLGMAILGVPFGSLIDRHRKHTVMIWSAVGTAAAFLLAGVVYLLVPLETLANPRGAWFWLFTGLILLGAMVAMIRGLALSTCVTILVASEDRAKANGAVGAVNGATMLVAGVVSGLGIGWLGIGGVTLVSIAVAVLTLGHLLLISIPEPTIVHAEGAPKAVDFKGAWAGVVAVPGLFGLILFSTFNNLLGGVFMGLLDPYGLELMSVQAWGILFGVCSIGFIVGGAIIAKAGLGSRPLRSLLLANGAMWIVAFGFALRDWIPLLAIGIFLYMALVPFIEAAEQTLLQRVVPLQRQGRVFGFAQAVEVSAAPISAFIIGPMAQFWLIPFAESERGAAFLAPLLGTGSARGIALVFVIASLVGLIVTLAAFFTKTYGRLTVVYAAGDVNADVADEPAPEPPGLDVLGKGHNES